MVFHVSTGTDARKLMSSTDPHIAVQHVNICLHINVKPLLFAPHSHNMDIHMCPCMLLLMIVLITLFLS